MTWFWLYWVPVGFLLLNGMPHFLAGCAGVPLKSPFGHPSRPRTNVAWGGANLVVATGIVVVHLFLDSPSRQDLIGLLVGAAVAAIHFGTRAKTFYFVPQAQPDARR